MSDKQRDAWAFRRVMWQRLDTPGTEICSLTSSTAGAQNGHLLITQVQVALNGIPRPYRCMVQCDAAWRTSEAWAMSTPGESVRLRVEDGRWLVSGREWRSGALDLTRAARPRRLRRRRPRHLPLHQHAPDPPPQPRHRREPRADRRLGPLPRVDRRAAGPALHPPRRAPLSLREHRLRLHRRAGGRRPRPRHQL